MNIRQNIFLLKYKPLIDHQARFLYRVAYIVPRLFTLCIHSTVTKYNLMKCVSSKVKNTKGIKNFTSI